MNPNSLNDHFMSELRDTINQAVSHQMQLFGVRQEHNLPHTSTAQRRAQSHLDSEEQQIALEQKLLS